MRGVASMLAGLIAVAGPAPAWADGPAMDAPPPSAAAPPSSSAPRPSEAPPPTPAPSNTAPPPSGAQPPPGAQPPAEPDKPAVEAAGQGDASSDPNADTLAGRAEENGWQSGQTEPTAVEPVAAPQPPAVPAKPMSRSARLKADPELYPRYRSARTLAIAGGVTGGIGVLIAINGLALLAAEHFSPIDRPPMRNAGLAFTGVGLAALIAGTAIMGVGLHRRAQVLHEVDAKPSVALYPVYDRHGAGLGLHLRF